MVIKASLLLLLVFVASAQFNINNQPVASLNDFSFLTPISGTLGKTYMYTFSLKTYYDI